jgi:hypothetical protein
MPAVGPASLADDRGTRRRRVVRGILPAPIAAGLTYVLVAGGHLPAPVSLAVLAGVLVLVPTATGLSRRTALNGSLLIGCAPVLWWIRWPFPVSHAGLVVAVGLGILAGRISASEAPVGQRLRALLPAVRPVDALIPGVGVAALASMWTWAFPGSAHRALVALLPGLDNVAHFHMFSTIRAYGATTQALGSAPDGSSWAFNEYPQGFHSLVATVSELTDPALRPGPHAVQTYTECVAAVVVLGLVVLTSAIVSVPALRARPLVALPVAALPVTAFLWKPGQNLLADGFANFWLAAAAAATALVLALYPRTRVAVLDVAAVGACLVAVAYAWAPLVVVASPAAIAVLHPLRVSWRDRANRNRLWLAVGVLSVSGLAVLRAVVGLFRDVDVSSVVDASGGIHGANGAPALALVAVGLYICAAAPALVRPRAGAGGLLLTAQRARVLTTAVVAGVAVCSLLLVEQLRSLGDSSYYFMKLFMGFELTLAALVPTVCGVVFTAVVTSARRRSTNVVAAVAATAAATQFFGHFPASPVPTFDAHRYGTAAIGRQYSSARMASGVLGAVDTSPGQESFRRDYLSIGRDSASEDFYLDAWYHAVLATETMQVSARLNILRVRVTDVESATPLARRLLTQQAGLEVVVAPRFVGPLRDGLGSPDLARRVVTWAAPAPR